MRTRFVMAGFIALCLIGGGPAAAQPATAPTQDALAAARELVQVARAADQLKLILPSIIQALKPAVVQGRPEVEKDFDAFAPALLDNMSARLPEFAAEIVLIYARNFTPEEMPDDDILSHPGGSETSGEIANRHPGKHEGRASLGAADRCGGAKPHDRRAAKERA